MATLKIIQYHGKERPFPISSGQSGEKGRGKKWKRPGSVGKGGHGRPRMAWLQPKISISNRQQHAEGKLDRRPPLSARAAASESKEQAGTK